MPSPDDSVNFGMTKLDLFVCNIKQFLNTNTVLYLHLIAADYLNFVGFDRMGKILV
ncbi:hypothetical protein [Candidatus Enterovibrio escicola]|uniref:hypothetical protein n=1 Tax=Candidatus Enterovibrio escicola TaxID=1927127 RepID=UPI0030DD90D6